MTKPTAGADHIGGEVVMDMTDVPSDPSGAKSDMAVFNQGTTNSRTYCDRKD